MSVNPRGGNYGGAGYQQEGVTVGRCRRGNNPWGHNPECDCRAVRASQVVPYESHEDDEDCPAGDCDKSDHDVCWSEYDRQENQYKYRSVRAVF